jgi:hypothetical protein
MERTGTRNGVNAVAAQENELQSSGIRENIIASLGNMELPFSDS